MSFIFRVSLEPALLVSANAAAFLPDTQPSRTARIERKPITGRFIKTALTKPGAYERNTKDARMWGIKTFASMATMYPNIR